MADRQVLRSQHYAEEQILSALRFPRITLLSAPRRLVVSTYTEGPRAQLSPLHLLIGGVSLRHMDYPKLNTIIAHFSRKITNFAPNDQTTKR